MHYADGTPAKVGDLIVRREKYEHSTDLVGIVMSIQPGQTTCNAMVIPLAGRQRGAAPWLPISAANLYSVTLKECWKLGEEEAPAIYDTSKHVASAVASG
jgi:hypothetical protein